MLPAPHKAHTHSDLLMLSR